MGVIQQSTTGASEVVYMNEAHNYHATTCITTRTNGPDKFRTGNKTNRLQETTDTRAVLKQKGLENGTSN